MTLIITIAVMVIYTVVGIITGAYTRNRSVNKSYNRRYLAEKESKIQYPSTYHFRYGNSKNEDEDLMLRAMDEAKRYDSSDWIAAGFLGGFFWPAFVIGFGFHWVYKKAESSIQPCMPKSDIEKQIAQIHKDRALEKERKELIRQARKMGLDTKVLEKLGE